MTTISDQQGNVSSSTDMAILFADIGGSTSLYQRAGDSQAHQLITNSLALMRAAVESSEGILLRTVGDAILARFDSCDQARAAAIEIQEQHRNSQLSVRVGFHWGPAIADDGDVYGNAVNTAARVAGLANTGEVLVTGDVIERLTDGEGPPPQLLDELKVKGIELPLSIYRMPWRAQGGDHATIVQIDLSADTRRSIKTNLLIEFQEQSLILDEYSEKCTIGRDLNNTVVSTHTAASRLHATIECKQGVYILEDLSTNGTYVIKENQPPVYVHRDTLSMDGAGVISMGFLPDETKAAEGVISFATQLID